MEDVGSVQGDNSVLENDDSSDKAWSTVKEMCRKNGANRVCICGEKSSRSIEGKVTKVGCIDKLNGVAKMPIKPSIPTLRSRGVQGRVTLESPRSRRRSTKSDQAEDTPCGLKHSITLHHMNGNISTTTGAKRLHNNNNIDAMPSSPDGASLGALTACVTTSNHVKPVIVPPNGANGALCLKLQSPCPGPNGFLPISPDTSRSCTPVSCSRASSAQSVDTSSTQDASATSTVAPEPQKVTSSSSSNSLSSLSSLSSSSQGFTSKPQQTSSSSSQTSLPPSLTALQSKAPSATTSDKKTPVTVQCQWLLCSAVIETAVLIDHIRAVHVDTQTDRETFVCKWSSCKVYDRPSSSKAWLERHVLTHSGDKPFRCIVAGCGQRFTSQSGLERHVNGHFNSTCHNGAHPRSSRCGPNGSRDDTPSKLTKRRKYKLRKRARQPKTDDFVDSCTMLCIQQHLVTLADQCGGTPGNSIVFHSTVIARQTDKTGDSWCLLHWNPENILPDNWVMEKTVETQHKRIIPLTDLPQQSVLTLHPSFYSTHRYRKHRRK